MREKKYLYLSQPDTCAIMCAVTFRVHKMHRWIDLSDLSDHLKEWDMKKRIYLIDYLKAVCVVMVIITHYDWTDKINGWFLFGINMAVPVFMLISGYNFTASGLRRADGEALKMYQPDLLIPKIVRFTSPFLWIYTLEIILKVMQGRDYSPMDVFGRFFEGGYGPGSYYYPLMLQLLFVFPLIFFLVKRLDVWGVVLAAFINFDYEICIHTLDLELHTYRLLIFRYLFLLALGCYLYFHVQNRIHLWVLAAMFGTGVGYIYTIYYADYDPQIFTYWTRTSMMTAFYIFPLVYLAFRYGMKFEIRGKAGEIISKIGQASYHIFLVQMVYYHFDFCNLFSKMPGETEVLVHIVICLAAGYLFYVWESRISDRIIHNINDHMRRVYVISEES